MSLGTLVDSLRLGLRAIPPSALDTPRTAIARLSRTRLRYLEAGSGMNPVVIVPDPPNTIEHHLPMVEALCDSRRVIVFELPGFGFSYPNVRFSFGIDQVQESIIELLDLHVVKDSTFMMSCLAAFAALRVAGSRPDLIARLVLAQTPSVADGRDWCRRMDRNGILGTPVAGQFLMATMGRKIADGWYRGALPKGANTDPFFGPAETALRQGGCYCLASAFQTFGHKQDETFPGVQQPVTLFWGSADRTHRPSNPHGLLDHVPHARIQVLEGCGHFPDLERTEIVLEEIQCPD